jgi:hypothetical protein
MRHLWLFLMSAPLFAQPISIGAVVGVPFLDPMGSNGESRPFAVGPTVEVRLPAGFAIEGSAIYRRLGETTAFNYITSADSGGSIVTRSRGNSWEFPVIGKYYFSGEHAKLQPFLGTGWSLRTVGWHYEGTATVLSGPNLVNVSPFQAGSRSDLGVGATAVAGLRFRIGRMSVLPEIRYTRWGAQSTISQKNDVGFFLELRF